MDPTAPDDDVYPLHGFDATKQRRIFVTRVLRFNDVLDAEVLRTSLSRLLEVGDWRKLGGCVRYTVGIPMRRDGFCDHSKFVTDSRDSEQWHA